MIYFCYGEMNSSALVVGHSLVDDFPHKGLGEAIEDVIIRHIERLKQFLGFQISQYLDQSLNLDLILERLDLVECLDVEDIAYH